MKSPPRKWLLVALAVAVGAYLFSRTQKGQSVIESVTSRMARSERNNNPGNIRTGTAWQGIDPARKDSDFVVFTSPEYGFRALARIVRTYFSRGKNTARSFIDTYAPPTENDTASYARTVAAALGVGLDDPLSFDKHLAPLIKAVARHETGYWPLAWNDAVLSKGIQLERA